MITMGSVVGGWLEEGVDMVGLFQMPEVGAVDQINRFRLDPDWQGFKVIPKDSRLSPRMSIDSVGNIASRRSWLFQGRSSRGPHRKPERRRAARPWTACQWQATR